MQEASFTLESIVIVMINAGGADTESSKVPKVDPDVIFTLS